MSGRVGLSLTPDENAALRALALECGVPPATLAARLVVGRPTLVPAANLRAGARLAKLQALLTQVHDLLDGSVQSQELARVRALRDDVEERLLTYRRALLVLPEERR